MNTQNLKFCDFQVNFSRKCYQQLSYIFLHLLVILLWAKYKKIENLTREFWGRKGQRKTFTSMYNHCPLHLPRMSEAAEQGALGAEPPTFRSGGLISLSVIQGDEKWKCTCASFARWALLSVRHGLITNIIISPRQTDSNCYYQSGQEAFPLVHVSTATLLLVGLWSQLSAFDRWSHKP